MNENIKVLDVIQNLDEEYKKLFNEFPPEEIFPFENIVLACKNNNYKILKFFIDELLLGTVFMVLLKDSKYIVINYFYIEKKLRGRGYGHKIINILKKQYADYNGIIVEVEPFFTTHLTDNKKRRIEFYIDLKFKPLNYKYKIMQTGKNTYQDLLLYMYNLNNPTNYIYKFKEIAEIIQEYYKKIFDTDYEKQYQLFSLED